MIRNVKSNYINFKIFLLFICCMATSFLEVTAMPTRITLQDNGEATCKIKVLKSTGEPQQGVYAKIFGNYKKFEADENGVITVTYTSSSYTHSATLYFNNASENFHKKVNLDTEAQSMTVYFDRLEEVLEYKRTARLFPLEGMLADSEGNPIEGATVSIQGTGRTTLTDEIGLFQIEGDFNHSIIIRADGMDNLSLPITRFFQDEEGTTLTMQRKNNWEIYASAEKMPEFPGGMKAFQEYLNKHLVYPEKAKKAKKEGVVVIQFIVETNGSISSPRIARHLEESMDSAAWRLIKDMPLWIPASDYGTTVRCKTSLPVAFKIPKPKPVLPSVNKDSLSMDSLALDSTALKKGLLADSLAADSLRLDSIAKLALTPKDSLQQDSTLLINPDQPTVKVKKRNAFVRFFRWLFGIERRERKRAEKELMMKAQADSIQHVASPANGPLENGNQQITKDSLKTTLQTLKQVSKANIQVNNDSVRVEVDSLNIDVKKLKQEAENFIKEAKAETPNK